MTVFIPRPNDPRPPAECLIYQKNKPQLYDPHMKPLPRSFLVLLALISLMPFSRAQTKPEALRLHVNCSSCDMTYIRQEMPYVAHVRDMAQADVQVFINRIQNASGGSTYEISITGASGNQELVFLSRPNMTRDEIREGLLKFMVAGLTPYLVSAGMQDDIDIKVNQTDRNGQPTRRVEVDDPWNYWVFELWAEGDFESEASNTEFGIETGFSADRITEDWRITTFTEFNYLQQLFVRDEGDIVNIQRDHFFRGRVVRSLSDHWSTGLFTNLDHDTYRNIKFGWGVAPAIEYSLFPYEEVIRREITFAYRLSYNRVDYFEETIYDFLTQNIYRQSVEANLRYRQPWGTIFSRLEASALLDDFSKNRVEFNGYLSVRVVQGLAVRFSSDLRLIRDQLSLPKGDASLEDQLLRQRQIATDFEMEFGIGLSYTFGSAFNNIVNTRL